MRWWWWAGWTAVAWVVASTTASATVLFLGLPDGRSVAYTRADAGWTRAEWADLPDAGNDAFPALGGQGGGLVYAFENVGTNAAPQWVRRADWDPPIDVGSRAAPALGDLDGD